jgi:D-alanine--poly(phosphoribitol) ligase subunit 2
MLKVGRHHQERHLPDRRAPQYSHSRGAVALDVWLPVGMSSSSAAHPRLLTTMSFADSILATIESVTGEPAVRQDLDLDLFGNQVLDSLRSVELLVSLSQRFNTDIALSEIDRELWATPKKIIAFMEERVGA